MPVISRRFFGKSVASGVVPVALADSLAGLAEGAGTKRPNILFICSDQHSGLALGAQGHPIVKTPNLDRLAARGIHFRNAYSGNPVCAPGRASMMTGMFASDVGSYCNSTPFDGRVSSWGNHLKQAGYDCWATGKMDLWKGRDFGFQEVHTSHGHSTGPDITSLFRAPVCFRPEERAVVNGEFKDRVAPDLDNIQRSLDFLRKDSGALKKPWVAYVGLGKPHPRWVAPLKGKEMYPPERMPLPVIPAGYLESRHTMFQVLANFKNISTPIPEARVRLARSAYFSMVTELDDLVGRLVDAIDQSKQWDNTLIVYTSDHGEMLGEHGLWLKNVLLEGAARVPLLLAGAGLPQGKVVRDPVSHVDMVATLLDLGGAPAPKELRGRSLIPLAKSTPGPRPALAFSESHSEGNCTGSFMIRKGDWKYLYFAGDEPLLFNLKEDPGELKNLAGRKEAADLQRELHGHLTSLLDPEAVSERAFVEQERKLRSIIEKSRADEFYEQMVGRLGSAQARVITNRYYRKETR